MNMENEFSIQPIIDSNLELITGNKPPDGQCTTWNPELAILLRSKGVTASVYGSPSYEIPREDGGKTSGHAITIAEFGNKWFAVDLSSAQVAGLPAQKIWSAESLQTLCAEVNIDLPEFMPYHPGDEVQFFNAAEASRKTDITLNRGKQFT